jgi:hypothetical protein
MLSLPSASVSEAMKEIEQEGLESESWRGKLLGYRVAAVAELGMMGTGIISRERYVLMYLLSEVPLK